MKPGPATRALYRLGSAPGYYRFANRLVPWCIVAGLSLLCVGWLWGLIWAPPDYRQGDSFRIIYLHLPFVTAAMLMYLGLALCALISLVWRTKISAVLADAIAAPGAWVTLVALGSGALWGKPAWGTYWVWDDPRLLSTLVLLLLYLGYIGLSRSLEDSARGQQVAFLVALCGSINLPVIRYSVEWWHSLHQGSSFTVTSAPSMDSSMWLPLLPTLLGLYLTLLAVVLVRGQGLLLQREAHRRWVSERLSGGDDSEDAKGEEAEGEVAEGEGAEGEGAEGEGVEGEKEDGAGKKVAGEKNGV